MNRLLAALLFLSAGSAFSQSLTDGSLTGKYFFRHLMILGTSGGGVSEIRTAYGAITFNGAGAYTYTGSQIVGPGAPAAFTGTGTYSVKSTGYMTVSNPQRAGVELNAGLGQGAIVASSTEAGGVYDLFIAIQAPSGSQSNASLSGSYDVSALEFPGGGASQMRNAAFRLAASGTGSAGNITVSGKAANAGDRVSTSTVANATYSVTTDGSGTLTLPGTGLLNGARSLWVSNDGALALFGSTTPGGHDLWVGTRAFSAGATNAAFRNLYFRAGLRYEGGRAGSYAGSANSTGTGKLVSSLRVRQAEGVLDLTGANNYTLNADGTGTLELGRLALGVSANSFHSNGVSTVDTANYEAGFAIRAAAPSGTGVYINPQGVVNAASFAPVGAPLSPGGFFTLFGSGLAPATTVASSLPFPTTLGGVQVLINGAAAPVYLTSSGQISALVPFAASGSTASITVVNNGQRSNTVEAPLARTSPGIFTIPPAGTGPGALLHANFTLVNAAAPARRGETLLLFLTGLGTVTPAILDGAAALANPLSTVSTEVKVYVGGRLATVLFKGLAPGLAGLYQINFTVPANASTGTAVPLAVETPEAFHDMVDIAVAN
ncbi:MAG: hypothetical protein JNM66_16200 [Bryobacterales bacterium]|nr:hypothetical protein [Bryobacterales bacterium]